MNDIPYEQPDTEASLVPAQVDPAAAAFEALREEVALVRRAVAGLAAEPAAIEVPNYSETLAQILQAGVATAKRLRTISEAPALRMSADNLAHEIAAAGEIARRDDHVALAQVRAALEDATGNLRSALRSARNADRQNIWLIATGIAGIVTGAILYSVISGLFASATPTSRQSPEQRAAAILGLSEEKAGEHLIQTASPTLWQDLVLGDRIVIANRSALNRCLRRMRSRQERCIIELPAESQRRQRE